MQTSFQRHYLSNGWSFREDPENGDHASSPWIPVDRVPTEFHVGLKQNNIIKDPFLDLNELKCRHLSTKKWRYKTKFPKPENSELTTVDLVFEGLDTIATVYLNGIPILHSDNMFHSHRVCLDDRLRNLNTLEIVFASSLVQGTSRVNKHPEHEFHVRQTHVSRVPVRKAQYHWGWDWGPILITAGPWKPIYLEQFVRRVEDVWADMEVSEDLQQCCGHIRARVVNCSRVHLSLLLGGTMVVEKSCAVDQHGIAELPVTITQPKLWYPFNHGPQTRYRLTASVPGFDTKTKMIGFRRAELVQRPDKYGKSFFFRINGRDVFCGGSCWIPADSFLSQVTPQRYRAWVSLLREGNQNMVRVWGGGIYESDIFYETCDELGVMVWQDFAFACASYPTYADFLHSVKKEAQQNIRRLRSHPSLVIWAGSNEDYQVQERYHLEYNYEDKDPQSWLRTNFPARYTYEYLLPSIVREEHPSAIYHPTSPWGDGKPTADPTVGDKHQWDIWHGPMCRYQEAPRLSARFISEFGMEAYPHVETTRRMITDAKQRYPGSMMMDFRNKAIDHERRLAAYVHENFTPKHDLESYTHLTQLVQAEAMRFAYKSWRRDWGTRKCGGVLVWQLNDCWPTMSWAVVDYYLVKKPAYYAIKQALRSLDVGISRPYYDWTSGHSDPSVSLRDDKFDLWIVSDMPEPVTVCVVVRFFSIRTGAFVREVMSLHGVEVAPNGTTEVLKDCHTEVPFTDLGEYDPYVIYATIEYQNKVVASDAYWPQPLKYLDFTERVVTTKVISDNTIEISAGRPTKGFVFQETADVVLSDNAFDLMPGHPQTVMVTGASADSLKYTYVGAPEGSIEVPEEESSEGSVRTSQQASD